MIFLTVSVLALSFPGCGKKENTSDRTLRVGIVTYTQDDPFINTMTEQIREDLKLKESKDMKILVSVKNGDNDQRDQDELVEEMIAAGCDVLCVNLVDRTAPSDIIKAARQEKIPVIFFNREPVKEDLMQWDQLYYVGCDAKQSGEMQGEIAADYLKAHPGADKNQDGKIQYVLLEGEAGHQDAISRTDCSVKTLIENGIELEKLSYQFADWNRGQAENRMSQLIDHYGTEIELVISNNDEMALGAVEAVGNKKILVVGFDATDDAVAAVKAGKMAATVAQKPNLMGETAVETAIQILQGETVEKTIPVEVELITKESVK